MRSTAILFGTVLLASPGVSANQTLAPYPGPRYPLVEAGSPKATIVLAESPDPLETYAAHELNRYVRAITGCELPIRSEPDQAGGYAISLGATRGAAAAGFELTEARLGRDGYAAAADPTGLLIAGRSPLGTLYGVYDLVEREFGVRWFVPGDLGEVVPRKETVAVGTFRREFKPSFTYRWVGDGDWALKQRMNVMVAVDGKPVGVNWKWHFHTFAILIPPEKYFDEHPEWFPLVNGKRQKSDQPHSHSTQLCTSNPEVVDKLTEGLLETLRADPTIVFDLPTRDKLRAWLDQAKARAGSETIEKRVAAVRAAFDACEKSVDPDRSSRGGTNRDQAAFEAPPQHAIGGPPLLLTGQAAVGDSKPNWKLVGRTLHHRSESQALDATESSAPFQVRVEAEEVVCELPAYETTNNGSGMFWGSGSAQMVRVGDRLFVSAFEAVPGVAPLNNARWALYQRTADGWEFCQRDEKDRTREPCPLGVSHSGRLLMSANPTLAPPVPAPQAKTARVRGGPARPEFLEFDPVHPEQEPRHWVPRWTEDPAFTEHSYRAFAADGNRGEFILFQKVGTSHTAWAFLDREDAWKTGLLTWPKGEDPRYSVWHGEYTPVNYANVILRDRHVHYLGPSPINIWNRIDPAKTDTWGRDKWGWRMRKLHYAWTPDIQSKPFSEWIVLDDTMDDGGTIGLGDSWLAPDGRLHLVWQKEPIHPTLRDLHFPDIKRDGRMYYGIVKQGELIGSGSFSPVAKPPARSVPRATLAILASTSRPT